MLIGRSWAFAHIPKCGGTAIRAVLNGVEAGDVHPLGGMRPVHSHLHGMLRHPPPQRTAFTVIRHPASWILSFWRDQTPERVGGGRYLHRYWSDDPNEFARTLCKRHPGYVGQLYDSYTGLFPMLICRMEDGLAEAIRAATGMSVNVSAVNVSAARGEFDDGTLRMIERSERYCLSKYSYTL